MIALNLPHSPPSTILVVDDNADTREALSVWLEMNGFQVEAADSGRAALQIMARVAIGAVFTDMWMPEMTGAELVFAIRRQDNTAELPIILMSAAWEGPVSDIGADTFLAKPFSFPPLLTLLAKFGCHPI